VKEQADNAKTYDLSTEMRPVHAKRIRNLLHLPAWCGFDQQNHSVHKFTLDSVVSRGFI
jgi:hypothetical protein